MGHTVVARLPKGKRWQAVVRLLAPPPEFRVGDVAGATTLAAERGLRQLRGDPSLAYCFWLLVRLAAAARGPDFVGDVGRLGIAVRRDDTIGQVLARIADHTRVVLNREPASRPFGELAALALRTALRETVGTGQPSLFGTPVEDLERAFRRHASDAQFGDLARRFFGDFAARTLRYYVDRELAHAVGGGGLATVGDSTRLRRGPRYPRPADGRRGRALRRRVVRQAALGAARHGRPGRRPGVRRPRAAQA